ncbi:MAG TPA: hypothetical protein VEA44_10410 [Caulobacter sp.]|nr:hypothetical protein [Caulobacter sp.]
MKFIVPVALAAALVSSAAQAQDAAPGPAPVPAAAPADATMVPAGTRVRLATTTTLNSMSVKTGDRVELTLVEPIRLGDREVVPAKTKAAGVVTFASGKGVAGRPGQIVVGAQHLDAGGVKIPLTGLKLTQVGVDLSKSSRFTNGNLKGSEAELLAGAAGDAWMTENLQVGASGLVSAAPPADQVVSIPRPPRIKTSVAEPPAGMGRVVFFRENVYFGGGWPLDIHLGPDFRPNNLGTIASGQYLAVDLPPGVYVFSTLKNGDNPMTIPLAEGEIVYVKGVAMGLGATPPTMIGPSDANTFNSLGKFKQVGLRKKKK